MFDLSRLIRKNQHQKQQQTFYQGIQKLTCDLYEHSDAEFLYFETLGKIRWFPPPDVIHNDPHRHLNVF